VTDVGFGRSQPEQIQPFLSGGGPGRSGVGVDGIGIRRRKRAGPPLSRDDARRQQYDCL
jgi:hypothetical protein